MYETTNITNTRTLAAMRAWNTETAGDYYRTYYRELVTRGASRAESSRRLEEIKMERRRVRREKWLRGIKSLADVLISSEAVG
ncbi:MAG TPA: hypothetical protein VIQ24_07700 [Pyrinomonadaceae bacterium]